MSALQGFLNSVKRKGELEILGGIRHFAGHTFLLGDGNVIGSDFAH